MTKKSYKTHYERAHQTINSLSKPYPKWLEDKTID